MELNPRALEAHHKARFIDSRYDMPRARTIAHYWHRPILTDLGRVIVAENTVRQLLEALMQGPVYCASRMALASYAYQLRYAGFHIKTHMFLKREEWWNARYGIYDLLGETRLATPTEVAIYRRMAAMPPPPPPGLYRPA